jgi:signal transduction histidine kinase
MQQVLTNLVTNAEAAMPAGGNLTILVEGTGREIDLVVEDSGTGISQDNLAKIFEPFFSTKPVGRGTGLGLAVVHGIVKMHQGRISVDSNADATVGATGTRFRVSIPRDEPGVV